MSTKIAVLLGTNRPNNSSTAVANYIFEFLKHQDEVKEVKFFSLAGSTHSDNSLEQTSDEEFKSLIEWCDGLVIVTPEYNHSYPGSLKRLLDSVHGSYIHKAVAVAGVSSGSFGGTRAVQALLPVLRELGLMTTFTDLLFPKVKDAFDESANPVDENQDSRTKKFVDELVWLSQVMAWGRENVANSFHQD